MNWVIFAEFAVLFAACIAIAFVFLCSFGMFEDSTAEYFRKHPNRRLHVTYNGRLEVNIKALLKDPKVRAQIEACRRMTEALIHAEYAMSRKAELDAALRDAEMCGEVVAALRTFREPATARQLFDHPWIRHCDEYAKQRAVNIGIHTGKIEWLSDRRVRVKA